MNLLPVRVVPLASDLPPGALADLLRGVVGDRADAPFAGAVTADGFVITRMKEFRSTVMPLARGAFRATAGGTRVSLRLRPPLTVIVFMGIWLGFLAALAAVIVAARARDGGGLRLLLVPGGLGALSWYLMTAVFAADARWAVERLVESVPGLRPGCSGD